MTVEAALAIPFFFLCMTSLVTMPDLFANYAAKTVSLQQEAEKAAKTATVVAPAGPGGDAAIIDAAESMSYQPFALPFSFGKMNFACRGRARAWVGYTGDDGASAQDNDEMVYVTDYESVYHTDSSCTHLDLTWKKVPGGCVSALRNRSGKKYHACEKCAGKGGPGAVVYLSPDGDAYHNSPSCSGLTRHVRMIRKSETEHMRECSRCLEREKQRTDAG